MPRRRPPARAFDVDDGAGRGEAGEERPGPVVAAVVNDDQFLPAGLAGLSGQGGQRRPQRGQAVARRQDDRDGGRRHAKG